MSRLSCGSSPAICIHIYIHIHIHLNTAKGDESAFWRMEKISGKMMFDSISFGKTDESPKKMLSHKIVDLSNLDPSRDAPAIAALHAPHPPSANEPLFHVKEIHPAKLTAGTWKSPVWKGKSSSKPSWLRVPIFRSVGDWHFLMISHHTFLLLPILMVFHFGSSRSQKNSASWSQESGTRWV